MKDLLVQVGLHEGTLNADRARIPIAKCAALFEQAAEVTGDGCFGLHFGQTRKTRDAGLIGYVGLSSPTVMEFIKNLSRYRRVYNDALELETDALEERGQLCWWFRGLGSQKSRQCVEFSSTNVLRALREMTGRKLVPKRIAFAHARTNDVGEFERFFGCPVRFGSQMNIIQMKISDLHVRLVTADDQLLILLRHHCQDVLSRHSEQTPSLVETVEHLIADRLTNRKASLESVATEVAMSSRSLSRRLAELDTSFSDLVENLRKGLALRYLHETDLSFTEIAFLLGYNNVSSFNHAFKRWTGKTPTAFRKETSD